MLGLKSCARSLNDTYASLHKNHNFRFPDLSNPKIYIHNCIDNMNITLKNKQKLDHGHINIRKLRS